MRSPFVLAAAGVLAVLSGAVLVWVLWSGETRASPPAEVVVGESPDATPDPPSQEETVAPPPPIVDRDGDGAHDEETETPGTGPSRPPAPSALDESACEEDEEDEDEVDEDGRDDDDD